MKTFITLALAGVTTAITQNDIKFMDYLAKHGKDYATIEEFNFRAALFAKKDAILAKINANPANTFTVGHNPMSDWTPEEQSRMRGLKKEFDEELPALNMAEQVKATGLLSQEDGLVFANTYPIKYPSSIDWKAKGAVTAVKYQGTCGSCWAFTGVAGIEGFWFQQSGQLIQLSEQQILDCNPQGQGCGGGSFGNVYAYATTNKIEKQSKYPYTAKQGSCKADGSGIKIAGQTHVIKLSVGGLKTAIARGPTSVSVASSEPVFNHYKEGVINDANACGTKTDHGVTAVGYTSSYYIIKNSWDTWWGDKGYAKIAINGDGEGVCGIQTWSKTPYIL